MLFIRKGPQQQTKKILQTIHLKSHYQNENFDKDF